MVCRLLLFFFSSRRRHTRLQGDWSSDVSSSDLREHITREGIMNHFATALIAGTTATVLISSIAFMPAPVEAAKLSKAERVALEKATAECKVEAKGMKFSWHWRKRQKYVRNCIIRTAVRIDPSINIS